MVWQDKDANALNENNTHSLTWKHQDKICCTLQTRVHVIRWVPGLAIQPIQQQQLLAFFCHLGKTTWWNSDTGVCIRDVLLHEITHKASCRALWPHLNDATFALYRPCWPCQLISQGHQVLLYIWAIIQPHCWWLPKQNLQTRQKLVI